MKTRDKIILYLVSLSLFLAFVFAIKSILIPFISAIVIAYFLNPLVNKLQKFELSRSFSTSIILILFLVVISLSIILIIPLFYSQMLSLFYAIPLYVETIMIDFYPKIDKFAIDHNIAIESTVKNYFNEQNIVNMFGFSGTIFNNIMKSGMVFINILSLIFITPVLLFYILRDWNVMLKKIDHYVPIKNGKEIRNIFKQIDKTLSGYIHGQFNVCLILGIFYSLTLSLFGLNFGFLIGFLTGFISFIPYVGMIIGVSVAIVVGIFQWGFDFTNIGLVLIIFLIGQVLESNFLTPKLVGEKIGLHPVWIIFGLFVFGVLFGFVGILVAMPATAICGVLIKFLALQYKKYFVDYK
jgi:predicted PurR-regulated permease PerM